MIAVINKKSDDVSFFILLFSVLKRPSENLPFHFSDDLLLVQLKNLVIANKVLNLS
jgi:autophagy-related protein 2